MVDLSPLLNMFSEHAGHAAELKEANYNEAEGSVEFYISCNGGQIQVWMQLEPGEDSFSCGLTLSMCPVRSDHTVFDFKHLKASKRYEEKLQEELTLSTLNIFCGVRGERFFAFRRYEVLDPNLKFEEQDLDRLVVTMAVMIREIDNLYSRLVALSEKDDKKYDEMVSIMPPATMQLQ